MKGQAVMGLHEREMARERYGCRKDLTAWIGLEQGTGHIAEKYVKTGCEDAERELRMDEEAEMLEEALQGGVKEPCRIPREEEEKV